MVSYNTKEWFSLIFKFHKSDTFRKLLMVMIAISLYTSLLVYVEVEVFQVVYKSTTVVHSLLGFVISLLLVFRTNTAYERWWEGRKQWGALVNNCRNLTLKINNFIPDELKEQKKYLGELLSDYVFALKEHLRDGVKQEEMLQFNIEDEQQDHKSSHIPNKIASKIYKAINGFYLTQKITGDHLIVMDSELKSLTDITGACERIKNTPIPFSYSLFLKKFIFVYIMTMPFAFMQDFGYWTILIVVFIFYVLASLELIAEEIEDPFGTDANDLPTDDIAIKIRQNVAEILS